MKRLAAVVTMMATLAFSAGVADATHTHVIKHNDGSCTVLGGKGREADVVLPGYDSLPENRRHPHHVKVHKGQPGEKGRIGVLGVMECGSYRNR